MATMSPPLRAVSTLSDNVCVPRRSSTTGTTGGSAVAVPRSRDNRRCRHDGRSTASVATPANLPGGRDREPAGVRRALTSRGDDCARHGAGTWPDAGRSARPAFVTLTDEPRALPTAREQGATRSFGRTWLVAFVGIFLTAGAWALATPLGAAPDEPAQVIRAASIVRGQVLGPTDTHVPKSQRVLVTVKVPSTFATLLSSVQCYQFKPDVPASCAPPPSRSTTTVTTDTYVGRYPPLYYLLVGLPTAIFVSPAGVSAARLVSCALSAAMLALAVCSVRRCRGAPLLGAGVAIAATPMAVFLAAVVNPNGLEVAAAISTWTAALALRSQPAGQVSRATVATLGASIVVLVLSRSLAPLWVLMVAVAFLALRPATHLRTLFARRDVQIWTVVSVIAALVSVVWDLVAHAFMTLPNPPVPKGMGESQLFWVIVGRLPSLALQSIGVFGWLDTPSPFAVKVIWFGLIGLLVVLGLSTGSVRRSVVTAGILFAWLAVPTLLTLASSRHRGVIGQGRDFMGLAVGIPLVAAVAVGEHVLRHGAAQRLARTMLVLTVVGQVAAFYWTLRRYTVGLNGPVDVFGHPAGGWLPPLPVAVLVAVAVAGAVLFASVLRPPPASPLETLAAIE